MTTLEYTGATRVTHQLERVIALQFDNDDAVTLPMDIGAPVKLLANGKVDYCAAAADVPVGHLVVGKNRYKEGGVTVQTNFSAVTLAQASATVTPGQLLSVSGRVAPDTTYAPAAAGALAVAICLSDGEAGDTITVGLLRSPVQAA